MLAGTSGAARTASASASASPPGSGAFARCPRLFHHRLRLRERRAPPLLASLLEQQPRAKQPLAPLLHGLVPLPSEPGDRTASQGRGPMGPTRRAPRDRAPWWRTSSAAFRAFRDRGRGTTLERTHRPRTTDLRVVAIGPLEARPLRARRSSRGVCRRRARHRPDSRIRWTWSVASSWAVPASRP